MPIYLLSLEMENKKQMEKKSIKLQMQSIFVSLLENYEYEYFMEFVAWTKSKLLDEKTEEILWIDRI